MSRISTVIVAAGSAARFGSPKQFMPLAGRPLLQWSVEAFLAHPDISEVVTVLPPAYSPSDVPAWLRRPPVVTCGGGDSRRTSAGAGVRASDPGADLILIHDAARPFATRALIDRVIEAAERAGAAVPGAPVVDTIKRVRDGGIIETVERRDLVSAQTPQGFSGALIRDLHARATEDGTAVSDDALLCELAGHEVVVVDGDPWNLKITTPEDMAFAEWLVESGRVRLDPSAGVSR